MSVAFQVAETGLTSVNEAQKTRIIVTPCAGAVFTQRQGQQWEKIKGQVKKQGLRGARISTAWL